MSFRARLLVFFTIIVVIPMIAVALVLFSLTEDSEHGKVDARLAGGLHTTLSFYDEARADARPVATSVASDAALVQALRAGDEGAITRRLRELAAADGRIESLTYYAPSGKAPRPRGRPKASPQRRSSRRPPAASAWARSPLSVTSASELARQSAQFTDLDVRVLRDDRVLATTIEGAREPTADSGDVDVGDEEYRARVQEVPDGPGPPTQLHVLEDASEMQSAIDQSRLLIGALIVAFLGLSLASSVFVVRALQGQIDNFLQAARRLGGGDLSERVPVQGDDEFAALGQEFNTMAEQLEAHVEEVERKRRELEDSIRRIGEAFGTGLDRQGIVDLAVRTAIQACNADAGRLVPVDARELEEVRLGGRPAAPPGARGGRAAGARAGQHASPEPAPGALAGIHALAMPLRRPPRRGGRGRDARRDLDRAPRRATSRLEQCDLLAYLTTQAAVSIENVDLHERIQRQAITDELTGPLERAPLPRAARPGDRARAALRQPHRPRDGGHRQLQERQRHLRPPAGRPRPEGGRPGAAEQSRDIDFPARYGGEEMSVILPQTDIGGAAMLAERMREAIEELEVRRLDGQGVLKMTASFGVAALPGSATDKRYLIAVADEALYRAKRAGKNRVERAERHAGCQLRLSLGFRARWACSTTPSSSTSS